VRVCRRVAGSQTRMPFHGARATTLSSTRTCGRSLNLHGPKLSPLGGKRGASLDRDRQALFVGEKPCPEPAEAPCVGVTPRARTWLVDGSNALLCFCFIDPDPELTIGWLFGLTSHHQHLSGLLLCFLYDQLCSTINSSTASFASSIVGNMLPTLRAIGRDCGLRGRFGGSGTTLLECDSDGEAVIEGLAIRRLQNGLS
jgi:hypothetical protein